MAQRQGCIRYASTLLGKQVLFICCATLKTMASTGFPVNLLSGFPDFESLPDKIKKATRKCVSLILAERQGCVRYASTLLGEQVPSHLLPKNSRNRLFS